MGLSSLSSLLYIILSFFSLIYYDLKLSKHWSSCTNLALSASWIHGLIPELVRESERISLVLGSNPTQAYFLYWRSIAGDKKVTLIAEISPCTVAIEKSFFSRYAFRDFINFYAYWKQQDFATLSKLYILTAKVWLFYPKFSSKFNEFTLKFQTQQEVFKKWLKLKQPRKPHICGIWVVRVNRQVNNPETVSKEGPFAFLWFFLTF